MAWDETSDSVCPIARGLSIFGDRWTLLIMREIGMEVRRFEDIQAQTGMSSNLLAMRLKRLEDDGMIERRQYGDRIDRFEYHATAKGKELDAVLLAVRAWGQRWGGFAEDAEPAVHLIYKPTGETIDSSWQVPPKGYPFSFDDAQCAISEAFLLERETRAAAFKENRRKPGARPAPKAASKTKATQVKPVKSAKAAAPVKRSATAAKAPTDARRAAKATAPLKATRGRKVSPTVAKPRPPAKVTRQAKTAR